MAAKYSDLNLSIIKHPNTRDIVKKYDLDAVKTAVRNLIRTNKGEKLFKPNFGADIRGLMFENFSPTYAEVLKRKWNEMLNMYEPRAVINNIEITNEANELYIILEVALRERPDIKFTLPISVERIR